MISLEMMSLVTCIIVYHPSIPVVIRWVVMFLHDVQLVPRVSKGKSPTLLHKQQQTFDPRQDGSIL